MKSLVFDAGPIISLTMNNLLWVLPELKKHFDGEFYITEGVKREIVDVPLDRKKFKFEAIQVLQLLNDGTLKVMDNKTIRNTTYKLIGIANKIFYARNHPIKILHFGEVSIISAAYNLKSKNLVLDEKTTRMLIENPRKLRYMLEKTLKTHIHTDVSVLEKFNKFAKGLKVLRSVELLTSAYELGILDIYKKGLEEIPDKNKKLVEAVLWGVKLAGCAVSEKELRQIVKIEVSK
tara:strand:+ start:10361 stop:11062 length:702 start_codon:yes stop_codon:yes gene_type:complete